MDEKREKIVTHLLNQAAEYERIAYNIHKKALRPELVIDTVKYYLKNADKCLQNALKAESC